ncbi:MAG: hypothetical protein ACKOEE_10510, partial [Tagaea sp.]
TPSRRPAESTSAAPLHNGFGGAAKIARSTLYSQLPAKGRRATMRARGWPCAPHRRVRSAPRRLARPRRPARTASPARIVARRPFAGNWEYMVERAIFAAPPNPLWSGAALVDSAGRLLGVGSLIVNDAMGMRAEGARPVAATFECLSVHVDMATRRAAPFDAADLARAQAAAAAHALLPPPEGVGRAVSMRASRT